MLDPWIIEQIRRREEDERRRREERPSLEIPQDLPVVPTEANRDRPPAQERGVVILNYGI